MRRFSVWALVAVAVASTAVVTTAQPAHAAPSPSASVACRRAEDIAAAAKRGAYVPPAITALAQSHCARRLTAADKLPITRSVSPPKTAKICGGISVAEAPSGSDLAKDQADCLAKWTVLATATAKRSAACQKRDNLVLQDKASGSAFRQAEAQCGGAATQPPDNDSGSGKNAGVGFGIFIIVALLWLLFRGAMIRRKP